MLKLGGTISIDGKLNLYDRAKLDQWRQKYAGRDIVLTVKLKLKNRSTAQNGYYWKVVVPMVTEAINSFGNDFNEEQTHEFLKKEFNYKEVEVKDGNCVKVPVSTGSLDTVEFMTYIEKVQQFASLTLGVYIPSPNEEMTIDF